MEWTDKNMLEFARIASKGAYENYRGCKTLISKLNRYKQLNNMSRYTKDLKDGRYIAYGFDNVLGYFFDLFGIPDEEGQAAHLIEETSLFTKMSNGKMLELMDTFDLPESHIEMVAMDKPII